MSSVSPARNLVEVMQACLDAIPDETIRRDLDADFQRVRDSIPFTAPEAMYLRWNRAAGMLEDHVGEPQSEDDWRWDVIRAFTGKSS